MLLVEEDEDLSLLISRLLSILLAHKFHGKPISKPTKDFKFHWAFLDFLSFGVCWDGRVISIWGDVIPMGFTLQ